MLVIRPVRLEDETKVLELVEKSGLGITTLPHSPHLVKSKIVDSLKSFKLIEQSDLNKYFFVLENLDTHEIAGCCGINAKTGINEHNDYYEIQFERPENPVKNQPVELKLLRHVDLQNGPSILCSLYLSREYRKGHLGKLISFSRFMFVALFPQLFTSTLIATIRGFSDEQDRSPFWEDVGRHFYDVDYDVILKLQKNKETIPNILPVHPIYVTFISQQAQESIGKPHINSIPAFKMLENEGFTITNEIDAYDAGPMLSAAVKDIRTIRLRQTARIKKICEIEDHGEKWLLSNNSIDFRACYGNITIDAEGICLTEPAANALKVNVGDMVHFVPIQ